MPGRSARTAGARAQATRSRPTTSYREQTPLGRRAVHPPGRPRPRSESATQAEGGGSWGNHGFPHAYRPAARVASRTRAASASVSCPSSSRQRQLPCSRPGTFIRASLPSPSRSCTGHDREPRGRGVRELDEAPRRVGRVEPGRSGACPRRASPTSRGRCRCRASPCRRRRSRGARAAGAGCPGARRSRTGARASRGGRARPGAARPARRDHAEVLGDQRQRAELGGDGVEQLAARPAAATSRPSPCPTRPARPSRRRSRGSGRRA